MEHGSVEGDGAKRRIVEGEGGDDGVEGGVIGGNVHEVEEVEGGGEVVVSGVEGDEGVPNDGVSVRGFVEQVACGGEGEEGAVEVEKGTGDEGVVGEVRGFEGVGVDGGAEDGAVGGGAGFEGKGEDVGVKGHG